MILRNGKNIKYNLVKFSKNIKIKYYILSSSEKLQKKNYYNNIIKRNFGNNNILC